MIPIMFFFITSSVKWPGLSTNFPKMAEKYAKYVKIKVFDTLIIIESFFTVGNDFKCFLFYS